MCIRDSAYAAPLFDNSTRNETYTVTKILDTKRKIPMDWTGSIQTCNAGTVNPDFQEGTIWTVNYARALAGLNPLVEDTSVSAKAQQAALLMSANYKLSHFPTSCLLYTSRCV